MKIWISVRKERNLAVDPYNDVNTEILEAFQNISSAIKYNEHRAEMDGAMGYRLKERGEATFVLINECLQRTYTLYAKELQN